MTADGRKPVVVVVDDDLEILRSLERMVRREPIELLTTTHPGEVLRWICERRIDLILSDQRMPEMSGTDLLEVVHDYSPGTACMILSGFPDTALIVEESGVRIERLVAKPWDNGELLETIRRVLQDRGAGSDEALSPASGPAVAIDCAGRTVRDVIGEVLPACTRARDQGLQPTIELRNPSLLGDSLTRLLKALARAVAWSHIPIDVRDDSGCVAAFLSALGRRSALRK